VQEIEVLGFGPRETGTWVKVNDDVMGGVSESALRFTSEGTAVFEGVLSLDNYGGFASVRTYPKDYALGGYDGLMVRVRGDGHQYRLRLRTDRYLDGTAYEVKFATGPDVWLTVSAPFSDFVPTFRGRQVRTAPPLDGARIQQIGFMIADKQAGRFWLEIGWVRAYRSES
jgi:NADH dehydrogenase [ubiquinone] 1 alpha subcomplex assembly factor 1